MSYTKPNIPDRTIFFSLCRKLAEINSSLIIIPGNKIVDGTAIQIAALTKRKIRSDLTVGGECILNIRLCRRGNLTLQIASGLGLQRLGCQVFKPLRGRVNDVIGTTLF